MIHPVHLPAAIDVLTCWIDLAEQIQAGPLTSEHDRRAYLQCCAALQERLIALLGVIAPGTHVPRHASRVADAAVAHLDAVRDALTSEISGVRSLRVELLRKDAEHRLAHRPNVTAPL